MAMETCCDLEAFLTPHRAVDEEVNQIGQTLIASFEGPIYSAQARTLVQSYAVGNVLLDSQNLHDGPQALRLTKSLHDAARSSNHPASLWVGIEQEGGLVSRLSRGLQTTQFPSPSGLAASRSLASTRQVGEAIAKELTVLGFDWNLAPVIDAVTDLTEPLDASRRFSDSMEVVVEHAMAFLQGSRQAGIHTTVKEAFSTTFMAILRSVEAENDFMDDEMENEELQHLQRLFGNEVIDSVMLSSSILDIENISHVSHSVKILLKNVIRKYLQFEGPVILDCTSELSERPICVVHQPLRALLCGCDMIYLPVKHELQVACINAIYAAIESSFLPISTISTAATRVVSLKACHSPLEEDTDLGSADMLLARQSKSKLLAQQVYRSSIVTLQGAASPLATLPANSVLLLLTPKVYPLNTTNQSSDPFEPLGRAISRTHPRTRHVPYSLSVGLTTTHFEFLRRAGAVIVVAACTSSALWEMQKEFWFAIEQLLTDTNERLGAEFVKIAVAASDARDLTNSSILSKGWWGVVCWEYSEAALIAVAEVLTGEREATGVLPFTQSDK
ncbi:MAG: hypothetical protein MMC33_001111 [Icmadophila ericetorum]|nr:hypothetical protein [Icmadophila ericetorum]